MKKAINAWAVDPNLGFAEMFAQVKAAGFDGIELNVDRPGAHSLTMETSDAELEHIRAISIVYGLPVVSVASSLWGSAQTAEKGCFLLERQLKCARALGARGVLTVPGGMSDTVSLARAYGSCVAAYKSWRPLIEGYGLFVGVENVWNAFFTSPFDMRGFIDAVGSPRVGAYFDVGNTVAFSRAEDWIEILGGYIGFVHVKDFMRAGGVNRGGTFCPLGKGSVNWGRVLPALRGAGFDGYLTAEVFKEDNQPYREFYRETAQALDKIIYTGGLQ